jgi:Spy/CpxP family protein refolding chaperone
MNIDLDGKRALVTGGSSGIGEAIVMALADAGAKVGIDCHAHLEAAQEIVTRILKSRGEAFAVQADVSEPEAVARMFHELDEKWEGIDILVNNAGIDGGRALGWEADLGAWRKVIEVNLFGAFYCAQQALKRMVLQKSGMEPQKMAQWAGMREHWRRVPRTLGGKIYLWEHYIISHRDVLGLTLQQLNDIGARLNDQRKNWIGKRADEMILFMEIEDLLLKEPLDLKKVEEKVKAIQALSGEMLMEEIRTLEKVLSLLTPEQRSMVREFMRESTFTRRIRDY